MKKLYLLTVGALADGPSIKEMAENFTYSKIHEYFDIIWIIITTDENKRQNCLFQTRQSPFKVNILIDPECVTNKVNSMKEVLLKMPLNALIWSIPESAIVTHDIGILLKNTINNINQCIVPNNNLYEGVDHLIFYRPPDGLIHDVNSTKRFFEENRKDQRNVFIPFNKFYMTLDGFKLSSSGILM